MNSSECRNYAEQCMKLAETLDAKHRGVLLDLADKWLQVATDLAADESTKCGQAG